MRIFPLIALAATLTAADVAQAAPCSDLLAAAAPAASKRPITSDDLVRLRDIGSDGTPLSVPTLLSLSPDGRRVAFTLYRGDPESNRFCAALVAVDLAPGGKATILDQGDDDAILFDTEIRGFPYEAGILKENVPVWSPDGTRIAYLKRANGLTQVWSGRSDGTDGKLEGASSNILGVAWSPDGTSLLVSTTPGLTEARKALEPEGLQGYLFDDRFLLSGNTSPSPRIDYPTIYSAIDRATGAIRPASETEADALRPKRSSQGTDRTSLLVRAADGRKAWAAPQDPKNWVTPVELWAEDAQHNKVKCSVAAACDSTTLYGLGGVWWSGGDVLFLHREGWAREEQALYRWTPGAGAPQEIFATKDKLSGCILTGAELLCLRDAATEPRRIVALDLHTGAARTVFDPNPDFQSIAFGKVERLHWRNQFGFDCYGDLVLPPGYVPGKKIPLVVVQYRTRGFLRGGVGDEYPIHLLAAHGYAVLSHENAPIYYGSLKNKVYATWQDGEKDNAKNFNERQSQFSSIMTGIKQVVDRGIADPKKIALTGLSDGSTSVRYALVNAPPKSFAAAIVSSCCFEGRTMFAFGGEAVAKERKAVGFPLTTDEEIGRWKHAALALNAKTADTPLLMQVSDDELLLALDTYSSLRMYHQPTEMYVYPGEHHTKWQTVHRRALYGRNLDWFDFWLQNKEDPDPSKAAQYVRWRKLRDEKAAAGPANKGQSPS